MKLQKKQIVSSNSIGKQLLDFLDDRTGYRGALHELLFERVPGGARWRYVWGSTLVFAFVVQVITGVVLWRATALELSRRGKAFTGFNMRCLGDGLCVASIM